MTLFPMLEHFSKRGKMRLVSEYMYQDRKNCNGYRLVMDHLVLPLSLVDKPPPLIDTPY